MRRRRFVSSFWIFFFFLNLDGYVKRNEYVLNILPTRQKPNRRDKRHLKITRFVTLPQREKTRFIRLSRYRRRQRDIRRLIIDMM